MVGRDDGDGTQVSLTGIAQPDYDVSALPLHEVVIMPVRIDGDVGIYRDTVLTLKKELRAQDVDAEYMHDAEHRRWLGLKGQVVGEIVIGLLTSGGVAALQTLLISRFPTTRLRVRAGRRQAADGSTFEWFEAEGTGVEVAHAFDRFMAHIDDSSSA